MNMTYLNSNYPHLLPQVFLQLKATESEEVSITICSDYLSFNTSDAGAKICQASVVLEKEGNNLKLRAGTNNCKASFRCKLLSR